MAKRDVNQRYFLKETPEQKILRLTRKAERDRRHKLDTQLQFLHKDVLARAGIEVCEVDGVTEVRVPWEIPENETDEETTERYNKQENLILELISKETKEQSEYRKRLIQKNQPSKKPRNETEQQRQLRLERAKMSTRLRRERETPDERVHRLQEQRLRTQRNREQRNFDAATGVATPRRTRKGELRKVKEENVRDADEGMEDEEDEDGLLLAQNDELIEEDDGVDEEDGVSQCSSSSAAVQKGIEYVEVRGEE